MVVAGYYACRKCGEWTPDNAGRRQICPDCLRNVGDQARTVELAYEVAGRVLVDRPTRARRHRQPKRDPKSRRLWNRARGRAMQRLVRIHRPLYEVLLAQEKAELGLDPHIKVRSTGSVAIERAMEDDSRLS